jgi:hypothetical protein
MHRIALVSVAFLLVVGCGSNSNKGELKGTITYKGQPVNAAAILLYPSADKDAVSTSVPVGQDGAFSSADVPPGDYRIVVKAASVPPGKAAPGVNASPGGPTPTVPFPDKYKAVKSTDLTCTVKAGENTPLKLELKD